MGRPRRSHRRCPSGCGYQARIDLRSETQKFPRIFELPFDPQRKRMTTVHTFEEGLVAYTKSSPQEIVKLCQNVMMKGLEIPLDDDTRDAILAANDEYARRGLRVLAVAMRMLPSDTDKTPKAIERGLTFLGLTAMMDPSRPEVSRAVEKCHTAGIRIVMITGDYGLTAESIARLLGIVKSHHLVLTGPDLDSMDDNTLKAALTSEVILARVTPEHKLRVVSILQSLGHVVAVTGDGVNDAPAQKKAD